MHLTGPLHPDDEPLGQDGRPFTPIGPGIYCINSTHYQAARGLDGDFRGTMRERCTNCGGNRLGIGVALYSHPWCTACLRSFNEDGTLKIEKVEEWHKGRRDLDNRVNPETFVASQKMQASDIGLKEERSRDPRKEWGVFLPLYMSLSKAKASFLNSVRKKKQI
jgi:hypothetical protein